MIQYETLPRVTMTAVQKFRKLSDLCFAVNEHGRFIANLKFLTSTFIEVSADSDDRYWEEGFDLSVDEHFESCCERLIKILEER